MKPLYLAIFSFIFIASCSLAIMKVNSVRGVTVRHISQKAEAKNYPPIPILSTTAGTIGLTARSVVARDLDSGVTLFEKNPNLELFPASTTKMITALTAFDYYPLDRTIKVGKVTVPGQKMGLKEGEEMTVKNLILGLLIYSANDAAEVLAENYCVDTSQSFVDGSLAEAGSCGREYFVQAMNKKAKVLHLENTNFVNPSGLDNQNHLTTAQDLLKIAIESMKNPFFREVVATKEISVTSLDGNTKHKLVNLNELVGEVDGVLGIKTGWTENAQENLVTYLERDNKKIAIVLLGSSDRFGETKQIIDWIFENYEWKPVFF